MEQNYYMTKENVQGRADSLIIPSKRTPSRAQQSMNIKTALDTEPDTEFCIVWMFFSAFLSYYFFFIFRLTRLGIYLTEMDNP